VFVGAAASAAEGGDFRLVDSDGRPAAGVTVTVVGRNGSTTTGADGGFGLDPNLLPPFDLALFDTRGALLGIVRVSAILPDVTTLTIPAAPLEDVTVRAGIAPSTWAPPAAAATQYRTKNREEQQPSRLSGVLDEIPGAGGIDEGQADAVPSLRGMARGRTLLMIDDSRVTAERRAGASAGYIDPFTFESVEILRGPGSVEYGSDALGGIMHVRTPVPSPAALGGRFEVAAGTGTPFFATAGEINVPTGPGALLVQVHARDHGDYESPEGEVLNSSAEDYGMLFRGAFPAGKAHLIFGVQVDRGDDQGKAATDSNVTATTYPTEESTRLNFGADWGPVPGFTALELRAFLGRYRLVTDRDTLATPTTPRVLREADADAKDWQTRLTGTSLAGSVPMRMGIDLHGRFGLTAIDRQWNYDAAGAEVGFVETIAIADAEAFAAGVFYEVESPLIARHLTFTAAARIDLATTKNVGGYYGDRSTSATAPSGYLAANVRLGGDWIATLQAARGFRDPTLSDRYFVGTSGRGTAIGNPDLDPETSDQYDFAVRGTAGPARLAGYAYLYRIKDLIERYRDDANPAGAGFPAPRNFFRNRGEGEITGLELEASFTLARTLTAGLGAAVVRGKIRDDGSTPNDLPADRLTFSLVQTLPRFWWRATVVGERRKENIGPTEAITPGVVTLEASVGFDVSRNIELRIHGWNLTDASYPAAPDAVSELAPGRSFALVVAGRF